MRKLLVHCSWFIAIFLGFGIWNLGFAASAEAACGCAEGSICRYVRPDKTEFSYEYKYTEGRGRAGAEKTITVYCDNQYEVKNKNAVWSPICGSSPEITPYCAQETADSSRYTCYGREWALGAISPNLKAAPDKSWIETGSWTFNGFTFPEQADSPGPWKVFVCDSIAFGCARSDPGSKFIDPLIPSPQYPLDSWLQKDALLPPICNRPSGAGESRLWIPHLRNISALATLLQTMYNPFPSVFIRNAMPASPDISSGLNNVNAVTTKVQLHQGKDDSTAVVNISTDSLAGNNSSLKKDANAPAPLYEFGSGSTPYNNSAYCSIAENDVRFNPGDDLLGPEITARLTYTQKYSYPTAPHPAGCREDNTFLSTTDRNRGDRCCSEASNSSYERLQPQPTAGGIVCSTRPGKDFSTEGRAVAYTKTPLVEYIYDTLVVGSQSVLRRIFPQNIPEKFEEIPSKAEYIAQASSVNGAPVELKSGDGSVSSPTLYFPHVGSLYEYFLQGLQKALRPGGEVTAIQVNTSSGGTIEAVAQKYGVPVKFLDAIWFIETGRDTGGNCSCKADTACGPMQIGGVAYRQVTKPGESLDRCKLPDAFELAARVLLHKKYCTLQSCNYSITNPEDLGGIDSDELYVAARYNGSDGCYPNNETQCRWGQGYSYCDAVRAITNNISLPASGDVTFCKKSQQ